MNRFQIEQTLILHGVPIHTWTSPKTKTVADLVKEIDDREIELVIDHEGLRRDVRIVSFVVTQGAQDRVLIEDSHILSDGTIMEHNLFPAGKIYAGEGILEALAREMQEELHLKMHVHYHVNSLLSSHDEYEGSRSFPGLRSRYTIYRYHIQLAPGVVIPDGMESQIGEEKLVFRWKPSKDYADKIFEQ